ncbi:AAA family ATPase, partial [Candidatus Saccharibacteria bacterium]|nr:AAA family ATPase [Candidatus Saccharibacteria bacterium]
MDNTNLISTKTQNNISEYLKGMWPVILICGKNGSGKRYVIDSIIKQIESGMPKGVSRNTYLNLVDPESSSISIEDIRDIKKRLKHKISSEDKLRIVVIHDCHRMTQESQNALLKILEETPPRTFFILSVNNKHKLLPTVISRTQILEIRNPTLEEYSRRFNGIDKDK